MEMFTFSSGAEQATLPRQKKKGVFFFCTGNMNSIRNKVPLQIQVIKPWLRSAAEHKNKEYSTSQDKSRESLH